jgi:hypothetical protein
METWIAVTEHHDVSDRGNVRTWKNGKWGRLDAPRPMKSGVGNHGYLRVNINDRVQLVHHLVLEAHVGPRPEGAHGAHFNGNKLDNRLENLRWATPRENGADNARLGVSKGELHGMHKLTEDAVREIRSQSERTYRSLAEEFGVSVGTIQRVIKRQGWTHVQ